MVASLRFEAGADRASLKLCEGLLGVYERDDGLVARVAERLLRYGLVPDFARARVRALVETRQASADSGLRLKQDPVALLERERAIAKKIVADEEALQERKRKEKLYGVENGDSAEVRDLQNKLHDAETLAE